MSIAASHIRHAADERAESEGHWFDERAAAKVVDFFARFLRHSKGQWAGQPFELLDWQREQIIEPLFGWKRPDGTRRFRKAYVEVPKKNGKSALSSGLSLYMLCGDGEPGAEVYNAAADREQATIVFGEAANMVDQSPVLASRLRVVRSTKRIVYQRQMSYLKALSADVPTKEGINWHLLTFDELHAQKTRHLWDTLAYGGAARRQPLLMAITTAGYDKETICWEQHEYAQQILDGAIYDPAFFAFISAADEKDDWTSPEVWRKANPSLGVTIPLSDMEDACREAQQSPRKQNAFRRYRLNQWTEQDVRWLDMDRWNQCDGEVEAIERKKCFAGLDLASTTDTASLVLLFPPDEDSTKWRAVLYCWVPENACKERERRNRVRLDQWIREGFIEQTPGDVIDYEYIRARLNVLKEEYDIVKVAIDRWNATQLATQLQGDGFEVVFFGQGFASMSAPTKELEKLVLAGSLAHGGNPVMRWMAGNTSIEEDAAGNIKPSKAKSHEKIDGIVALIMAKGIADAEPDGNSVYDSGGVKKI